MAAEGAWLDLASRKHRDRHGPMGPGDSSAGGGAGDGGAAEEMDQDGSDVGGSSQGAHWGTTPNGWDQMAVAQRQNWHKHRRNKEIKARAASRDLSRFAR